MSFARRLAVLLHSERLDFSVASARGLERVTLDGRGPGPQGGLIRAPLALGLDLSEAAISPLAARQDATTRFEPADAESYTPTDPYDAIVFNESLYYFREPLTVVDRYVQALNPGGLLVTSLYEVSPRARPILARLHETYSLLDETQVVQKANTWRCSVFVPRR
jgi:trans-aconitate methyltransferase